MNEEENNFDNRTHTGNDKTYADIDGELDQTQSEHASLVSLNDADDEFFDVLEPSDCDELENGWTPDCSHKKFQVKSYLKAMSCFTKHKKNDQIKVMVGFVFSKLI